MAKNHQIYNASLDEDMLYDLVRSVLDNEETGLFVLNERLSPHHPVFNPSLYLNRSHRPLEELLVLPDKASSFQKQLISLLAALQQPQFALHSSPYQINASLLAHRNVSLISFKPVDILSLTKDLYQSEIEELRNLHVLALKLKEPKAPFDQIRFQSQDRLALLRALAHLQSSFEDLYNVCHLPLCALSKNYGQNKAALLQMLSLMQKTSAAFRKEQKEAIEEFLRSLQKHRQASSIEVFLKWLRQELVKAEQARDKLLACQSVLDGQAEKMMELDPGLKHALNSYQSQNPLLSKAQIIDHWLNSNREWQKKWMHSDPARLMAVAKTMEQKTNAFLKQERGLLSEFNRDALSFDAQSYLERYQTDYATIFRYFKPAYYRDKRALNAIKANPKFKWSVDETIENLENLIHLQKQYNWLASFYGRAKELFGKLDDGLNTDFDLIYRQIELQNVYREWSAQYGTYQVLLAQNKSIAKNMKQDLAGLYQDEHTDYRQIAQLIDWLIDYFHTPYSSLAGAKALLEQRDLSARTLEKSIRVFDSFEQSIDGLKEFVQDRNFIRFKRALCSKPVKELKFQFRALRQFERDLAKFNEALRSVKPESSLHNLLKAIHFSIRELKNPDVMAAYQKQVLTSWLFAALSRLIQTHLLLEGNETLTNELLKELLTILDMEYYSQRDEKALVKSDREWAQLLPSLLQSLYPIWLLDHISEYEELERPAFDMVYFFSPVELSPKALRADQDYFILDLQAPQKSLPESQSQPEPDSARNARVERAQRAKERIAAADPAPAALADPVRLDPRPADPKPAADPKPESKKGQIKQAKQTKKESISPSDQAVVSYSAKESVPADPKQALIRQIVKEQYPIHCDLLANEILPQYGRKRMTAGIRKQIQKDIEGDETLLVKGSYVYPKGYGEIPVRSLKRKLQHISDDEILQALRQADQKDPQKRILQAANALGFKTTNTPILKKFGALLEQVDQK